MKIKVDFFNKKLIKTFANKIGAISTVTSLVLIFFDIPESYKIIAAICFSLFIIVCYFHAWFLANREIEKKIEINNSIIHIKTGDIFTEDGLKVISFNEYFDTEVNDILISEMSLNGIYLLSEVSDIVGLDCAIENNLKMKNKTFEQNIKKTEGKNKKYKLGTIFRNGDYLLTAFSRFDDDNRAFLNMVDYIKCLLNFWNEVDIIYSGKTVVIPLMGSGITRFKGYEHVSEQELLELLIWSFKVSKIKFNYPSKVSIIIDANKMDKINLYSLS